jgi:hypothetical protein
MYLHTKSLSPPVQIVVMDKIYIKMEKVHFYYEREI